MFQSVIFEIEKDINHYKVTAKTRLQKSIGEFEIKFITIRYGPNGKLKRTIPTMSIEVNEKFQGHIHSKYAQMKN